MSPLIRVGPDGDGLWRQIPRLVDARPGDLIAWRKPTLQKGKTTGHVLMVAGPPVPQSDGRIRIRVLDSTGSLHENDTRPTGNSGIGAGLMWFEVDNSGRPVALTIRKDSKRIDSNPILIGRLQSGKLIAAVTDITDRGLIGRDEDGAARVVRARGLKWRIISWEGIPIALPLARPDPKRLNIVIEGGKVERVRRG